MITLNLTDEEAKWLYDLVETEKRMYRPGDNGSAVTAYMSISEKVEDQL